MLREGQDLQRAARKEFDKEDKSLARINEQEQILRQMLGDLRKEVEGEFSQDEFQRQTKRSLDDYFKGPQLKQTFERYREQARHEFRAKKEFLLSSIQQQTEDYVAQVRRVALSPEFNKETPQNQELILARCRVRFA